MKKMKIESSLEESIINEYSFSSYNEYAADGIQNALCVINRENKTPIVVCVGSDLILGDSLGPLVGTLLRKSGVSSYVYGTLNAPITAKEVEYAREYLKKIHPNSCIIAIDAAVGGSEDVGLIRVGKGGLRPGAGIDKEIKEIGDAHIIGVVAAKSVKNRDLFHLTRLNLVYRLSERIFAGVEKYLASFDAKSEAARVG